MRRLIPLLLIAAIWLGACSPKVTLITSEPESGPTTDSPSSPPTATAAVSVTATPTQHPGLGIRPDALQGVEVVAWDGWDGQSASLFQQMATEFSLTNQWGITVKVVHYQNLSLLAAEVDQVLQAQDHPDLLVALPEQLLGWQAGLLDLALYTSHPEFGINQDDIPPAFWEQSLLDGVRYGVPALRSARLLFYNVTWAQELGFEQAPRSWEEFREQACAANASWKTDTDETNDGFGGLALDLTPDWQTPYAWLRALDGEALFDGKFAFETNANKIALKQLFELRSAGCAWLPSTISNYEHLAARRALFITGSLGELNDQKMAFAAAGSADEWTLLPFPGNQAVVPVYGPDYAVLKSSDARQLASWLFIRWLLQPENQARWVRDSGLLPVRTSALYVLKDYRVANPQWSAAADALSSAVVYPQSKDWGLANKVLADGFLTMSQIFPNASPEGVLAEMDATLEELGK